MALINLNLNSAVEIQTPTPAILGMVFGSGIQISTPTPASLNLAVGSAVETKARTPAFLSLALGTGIEAKSLTPSRLNLAVESGFETKTHTPEFMSLALGSGVQISTPTPARLNLAIGSYIEIKPSMPAGIDIVVGSNVEIKPLIPSRMDLAFGTGIETTTLGLALASPASLVVDTELSIGAYNIAPYVFVWSPQAYHIKRYGVAIGSYDLSSQATAVSAVKSEGELYLSVTIAGMDAIEGITANQLEQVRFYTYWHNQKTGEKEQIEELLAANFESIDPHIGGRSRSLMVQARSPGEVATTPATYTVENAEYSGGNQLRLQIMAALKVGDTVEHQYGSLTIKTITHTFGAYGNGMTLTGV